MRGLALSKKLNDTGYINIFLLEIGLAYQSGDDKRQAIFYFEQANKQGAKINDSDMCAIALNNIAETYRDSSLITHDQQLTAKAVKSFREAIKLGSGINNDVVGDANLLLGEIKFAAKELDSALYYYRKALTKLPDNDRKNIIIAYKDIANIFLLKHHPATAYKFMQTGFDIAAKAQDLDGEKYLGAMLSSYYESKDDRKSLYYYKLSISAKDSLKSDDQYKAIQQIKIKEQLKDDKAKKALALIAAKEAEERREGLQYLLIVCCILIILSLALFFSGTALNIKYVDYMGVFSLLLLFEFITLFIHPIVQDYSNHSPMIELLALVVFASVMGYCHEKSTDWIKEKLEKRHNKKFNVLT
jgi:TPR repeat protein